MSNPNNFKPFELNKEAENIKLTSSGFKREGGLRSNPGEADTAKYVCKITDAVINFAGDNSKFAKDDKKKLINTLFLVLPKEQSDNLQSIIDETGRENLPYKERDGEIEFKVKLNPKTKFVDKNKKPIKIDLKKFPCEELREYVGATIDLVVTGESKEFESEEGEKFSYTTLTAIQIKVKDMNSIFDCDCDFL